MTKSFKSLLAAAALMPIAFAGPLAPAAAQTPAPVAPVPAPAPGPAAMDDADPALWVVKDSDTTIYLFGTVHMLKPGLSWFDEAVKDAFDKSDALKIEVVLPDDPNEAAKRTIPVAMDQSGATLSSQLTDDQRKAYETAMSKLNLPVAQFDVFEPWFAGLTLASAGLMAEGYLPDLGSEKILTTAAKAAGKSISGLETLEEQLGFFDTLPRDAQLAFLNESVKQMPTAAAEFADILFMWTRGNPDELGVRMNRSMLGQEQLADVLLYKRNARWAEWIKTRLDQPGTVFVAVGAGHLAGPKSVQDYLKAHGLSADRIIY